MNLETMNLKKDMILMEIDRDQTELRSAIRDLGHSVSVSEKIVANPRNWLLGALVAGVLVGELT